MRLFSAKVVGMLFALVLSVFAECALAGDIFQAEINGVRIDIDKTSGCVVGIYKDGVGELIDVSETRPGLIDMAYPLKEFEALRCGSSYSKEVQIEEENGGVKIHWPEVGFSRDFDIEGEVAATVWFMPHDDGESLVMKAEVKNGSTEPVRQVLFPDLVGFREFCGEGQTNLRTCGFEVNPFFILKRNPDHVQFYARGMYRQGINWVEYHAGGWGIHQIVEPWTDLGGIKGGISMFPKRWGWDPMRSSIMLHLSEKTGKIRMLRQYKESVEPKTTWNSEEFVVTVHENGWAKGIVPFKKWVADHINPEYPLPKHVEDGLGFRTVYMAASAMPGDPAGEVVYRFSDLPEIALDAKEHGLDEMVVWFWCPPFEIPMKPLHTLGTKEEFVLAVKECRNIGVNVTPFISVFALADPTASKYGLEVRKDGGWTYHTDMVPMFNPYYATGRWTTGADQHNVEWQKDVIATCSEWIEAGVPSIAWDVWKLTTPKRPNLISLTEDLRRMAKAADLQSVFAGESQDRIEVECDYLDYTWNWRVYSDVQAFNAVFAAPRINVNIDTSVHQTKRAFVDNTYMNIMPRALDGINGSAMISDYPALGDALKQCAKLRKQFLGYFTRGRMIGDGVLAEPLDGTHSCGYVLDDKLLFVVLDLTGAKDREMAVDLGPWLPAETGEWTVQVYDGNGEAVREETLDGARWNTGFGAGKMDFAIYEFCAVRR